MQASNAANAANAPRLLLQARFELSCLVGKVAFVNGPKPLVLDSAR